ncbi:hypothetical protein HDU96_009766 [Phlyctochytrium bullatum]|nr:hypothetical protein HDU96_009766 [Phlyctochytrium bullatum]
MFPPPPPPHLDASWSGLPAHLQPPFPVCPPTSGAPPTTTVFLPHLSDTSTRSNTPTTASAAGSPALASTTTPLTPAAPALFGPTTATPSPLIPSGPPPAFPDHLGMASPALARPNPVLTNPLGRVPPHHHHHQPPSMASLTHLLGAQTASMLGDLELHLANATSHSFVNDLRTPVTAAPLLGPAPGVGAPADRAPASSSETSPAPPAEDDDTVVGGAAPSKRRRTTPTSPPTLFACPHPGCDRTFNREHNLKSHAATHAPKPPKTCAECGQRFQRRHDLVRHVRAKHSTERPFRCHCCSAGFSRTDSLKKHLEYEAKKKRKSEARERAQAAAVAAAAAAVVAAAAARARGPTGGLQAGNPTDTLQMGVQMPPFIPPVQPHPAFGIGAAPQPAPAFFPPVSSGQLPSGETGAQGVVGIREQEMAFLSGMGTWEPQQQQPPPREQGPM